MILLSKIDQESLNDLSVNFKSLDVVLEKGYHPEYEHWSRQPYNNKSSHNKKIEVEMIRLQSKVETMLKELKWNVEK